MFPPRWLKNQDLQLLLDQLRLAGFRVIGPTIEQQAIVYQEISCVEELPQGWSEVQSPGCYRIERTPQGPESQKYFHFNLGPHSWKKFLFPPHSVLPNPLTQQEPNASDQVEPIAILGARACELAAIAVQDKVFMNGPFVDAQYALRRKSLFVVALQCTTSASTCFCTSMNTGPALPNPSPQADPDAQASSKAQAGAFDLALTELILQDGGSGEEEFGHGFLVQAGSPAGAEILSRLPTAEASLRLLEARDQTVQRVAQSIQRSLPTNQLRDPLMARLNHPHWEDVANRCLSCANCTMVCPTCFCSSVDEVHDLVDDQIVRHRRWDSCFNPDFTHTSGAPVRNSVRSRYRQWLTHKLATWHDQFDTSGCVGCGRCITWCPVGIDLTQEVAKLLEVSNP